MLVSPQGDGVRPRKGTHERDTALGALAAYLGTAGQGRGDARVVDYL